MKIKYITRSMLGFIMVYDLVTIHNSIYNSAIVGDTSIALALITILFGIVAVVVEGMSHEGVL